MNNCWYCAWLGHLLKSLCPCPTDFDLVKAVVLKLSPFLISAAATIPFPRPTESETLKVGLATCTLIIPKVIAIYANIWELLVLGKRSRCLIFKMVPSVTIFWGSKDNSHLNFGNKGTLKVIWHPSEHLRADCWWLPAHTPFPCAGSSKGDFLPPHPQVTHRCVPFLHRKLKEKREKYWMV